MKRILLSLFVVSLFVNANAQMDGFFPQFGQESQWKVNDKFELVFTGAVDPAPVAAVATTFEGLVSDGIGGNDFTGLNLKFDAYLDAAGGNTTVLLSSNGTWGGKGIVVELSIWLIQVATNFTYDGTQVMVSSDVPAYQGIAKGNAYNAFEINVDAAGVMTFKINGYTCPTTYGASVNVLKATSPAERTAWFTTKLNGFKIKNIVASKGTTVNKYFYDPEATSVSKVSDVKVSVFPNPTKANVVVNSNFVGKKYEIKNILGQRIQQGLINSANQQISLEKLSAGNYMLVIDGENGKITRSIIKQ